MTRKAKEYFDLWEADRDTTDAAKSYEELLGKVKDYTRRRKLNSSAKEKMLHGGDPMDVGAAGGWSWYGDVGGAMKCVFRQLQRQSQEQGQRQRRLLQMRLAWDTKENVTISEK